MGRLWAPSFPEAVARANLYLSVGMYRAAEAEFLAAADVAPTLDAEQWMLEDAYVANLLASERESSRPS